MYVTRYPEECVNAVALKGPAKPAKTQDNFS